MEIAIVGADADVLCEAADVGAQAFPTPAQAAIHSWDLLALTIHSAAHASLSKKLRVKILLMPGDGDPSLARSTHALQIIGYGFSPRDTLTLSSLTGPEPLLCLQRSLLTPDGALLEPQELPLPPGLSELGGEHALLVAGLRLLCGML